MLLKSFSSAIFLFATFELNSCYFQHPPFSGNIPTEIIDIPDGYNPYGQWPTAVGTSMFPNYASYPSFYGQRPSYRSLPVPNMGFYGRYPAPYPTSPKKFVQPMYPQVPRYTPTFYPGIYPTPYSPIVNQPFPAYPPVPVEIIDVETPPEEFHSKKNTWCSPQGYCIEQLSTPQVTRIQPAVTVTQEKTSHVTTNPVTQKAIVSTSTITGKPVQTTITRLFSGDANDSKVIIKTDGKKENKEIGSGPAVLEVAIKNTENTEEKDESKTDDAPEKDDDVSDDNEDNDDDDAEEKEDDEDVKDEGVAPITSWLKNFI